MVFSSLYFNFQVLFEVSLLWIARCQMLNFYLVCHLSVLTGIFSLFISIVIIDCIYTYILPYFVFYIWPTFLFSFFPFDWEVSPSHTTTLFVLSSNLEIDTVYAFSDYSPNFNLHKICKAKTSWDGEKWQKPKCNVNNHCQSMINEINYITAYEQKKLGKILIYRTYHVSTERESFMP